MLKEGIIAEKLKVTAFELDNPYALAKQLTETFEQANAEVYDITFLQTARGITAMVVWSGAGIL